METEKDYKLVLEFIDYVICSKEEFQEVVDALNRLKEKAECYEDLCD